MNQQLQVSPQERFVQAYITAYNQAAGERVNPAEKLQALGNLLILLFNPKNQVLLDSLGEQSEQFRRELVDLVARSSFENLLATVLGLPVIEFNGNEDTRPRRITKNTIAQLLAEPILPEDFKRITGKPVSKPVRVHTNSRLERVVMLLGRYGSLSHSQLVLLTLNSETEDGLTLPSTLSSAFDFVLEILKIKNLIFTIPTEMWNGKITKLVSLDKAGIVYHSMLGGTEVSVQDYNMLTSQAKHTFGTRQFLAGVAAACQASNRLLVLDKMVKTVLAENPSLNVAWSERDSDAVPALDPLPILEGSRQLNAKPSELPPANFNCRLEVDLIGERIVVGKSDFSAVYPDATGKIVFDTDLVIPTVLKFAGLNEEETSFVSSQSTNRQTWSFFLEYDRATEKEERFLEKVDRYSELYNSIKTAWRLEWGNEFPTILVVTEGTPNYLLTIASRVRTRLAQIKEKKPASKRLGNWWFTNVGWFNEVFSPYLSPEKLNTWYKQIYPNVGGRTKKPSKNPAKLELAPNPRIWMPLDVRLESYDLKAVDRYFALSGKLQPPPALKQFKALPLFTPFNTF